MKNYNIDFRSQKHYTFEGEPGKTFVVGDIHGNLQKFLDLVESNVDKSQDKILFCGDLINRGSESLQALNLLEEPWFYPVLGNHDYRMLGTYLAYLGDAHNRNDLMDKLDEMESEEREFCLKYGKWLLELSPKQWKKLHKKMVLLKNVPLSLLAVDQKGKRVGVVHNDVLGSSFETMMYLPGGDIKVIDHLIYQRDFVHEVLQIAERTNSSGRKIIDDTTIIMLNELKLSGKNGSASFPDVDIVAHGHTVFTEPTIIGNRIYMETGGYKEDGVMTMLTTDTIIRAIANQA